MDNWLTRVLVENGY